MLYKKRIIQEIEKDQKLKDQNFKLNIKTMSDDECIIIGQINGPINSPYSNGKYLIEILITNDDYPFKPPKMKFVNKIWHPNICERTGTFLLEAILDFWIPTINLSDIFSKIQQLINKPIKKSIMNKKAFNQLNENEYFFRGTASFWNFYYADGLRYKWNLEDKMISLINVTNNQERALDLLTEHDWNVQDAIESYRCKNEILLNSIDFLNKKAN